MDEISQDQRSMLSDAITRAEKLLSELLVQQADLDKNPPAIPPDDLKTGRQALQNAIASAQRMLQALKDAQEIADGDFSDPQGQ